MIASNTRENLTADCGQADRNGRRHFTAKWCGEELHRDVMDADANWHRAQYAMAVFRKLEKRFSSGDVAQEQLVEMFGGDPEQPDLTWVGDLLISAANAVEEAEEGSKRPAPIGIATLSAEHPRLAPYIIDGILRRGETMNIIAPPKKGKSWLGYQIDLSINVGRYWLDTFPCHSGRVLHIDNELHPAVIASRIKTTAEAMGIQQHEYADNLDILSLRGRLLDLNGIAMALEGIEPGTYDFILLDAFYRMFAPGVSENDNSAVAGMYNTIDGIAKRLDCAVGLIHHSSKGSQADKSVVDVGAGAGSQSRAADAHVILREHEEKGVIVLEAVVRSFAPVEPLALRWNFPLWQRDDGIDVKAIKGRLTRTEQRTNERDEEGANEIIRIITECGKPMSRRAIVDADGPSRERCAKLLTRLVKAARLAKKNGKSGGQDCAVYALPEWQSAKGGRKGGRSKKQSPTPAGEKGVGAVPKGNRPPTSLFSGEPPENEPPTLEKKSRKKKLQVVKPPIELTGDAELDADRTIVAEILARQAAQVDDDHDQQESESHETN